MVWSGEAGGTKTEAQAVLLRSKLAREETTSTTIIIRTELGADKVRADQLRKVFCLIQSFLRLVERTQQGRIVPQESLEVSWPGGWS